MLRRRLVSIALAVMATAPLAPAFAQTSEPPQGTSPESVLFEDMPVVEAATLHNQTLQEAPASITIITAEDIRKYGFRTLGEALAAVRGFYVTYDRSYHYAGLRGFSIPGDYNTRFLAMLNGHYLTENIYSSNNFFGQDFDLDMDLVKRIEIVRGPSSALYGSNGIFATINIVTKSPVEAKRLRASTEIASFGERKGMISAGLPLGRGANLLLSASVFNNGGQSLYFPEFDSPATDYGRAIGGDGERGYHTFANLIWRNWTFTGYFGAREKQVPTAWYRTVFNDPANRILDARGFFEAAYSRDLSSDRKVRWRIYYDRYRYRARYDYADGGLVQDWRDLGAGDWVGTQLAYDFSVPHVGVLTVGSELNADLRALQHYYEASPDAVMYLSADHPDISYGFFAQQQWQLSPKWNAYFGVRFDDSKNHRHFVSPRVALVYQASAKSSYKFLVGRAFRNPNAYEEFYADGISQVTNWFLRPEKADTYEVSAEHRFTSAISGLVTAYHYRLGDLIQATTLDSGMTQYQNVARSHASGVEGEFSAKPLGPLETTASLAVERAGFDEDHDAPGNSPRTIGKLRAALPLAKNKLKAAAAVQYLSSRYTMTDAVVPSYWLADLTFTTNRLHPDFDLQFGVRNLFNRAYYDPVGVGLPEDRILEDGRALFVKLIWRTRE
ncbi:MAG TPA: TonB-dependent receptor [Bryobacteraceae bacterium]|nr:TonB-dependent receptor [Bryobacteraceae bacterium]